MASTAPPPHRPGHRHTDGEVSQAGWLMTNGGSTHASSCCNDGSRVTNARKDSTVTRNATVTPTTVTVTRRRGRAAMGGAHPDAANCMVKIPLLQRGPFAPPVLSRVCRGVAVVQLKRVVLAAGAALYAADVVHVHRYLASYFDDGDSEADGSVRRHVGGLPLTFISFPRTNCVRL